MYHSWNHLKICKCDRKNIIITVNLSNSDKDKTEDKYSNEDHKIWKRESVGKVLNKMLEDDKDALVSM